MEWHYASVFKLWCILPLQTSKGMLVPVHSIRRDAGYQQAFWFIETLYRRSDIRLSGLGVGGVGKRPRVLRRCETVQCPATAATPIVHNMERCWGYGSEGRGYCQFKLYDAVARSAKSGTQPSPRVPYNGSAECGNQHNMHIRINFPKFAMACIRITRSPGADLPQQHRC